MNGSIALRLKDGTPLSTNELMNVNRKDDMSAFRDVLATTMANVHSGRLESKIGTAMAYMGTALLKAIETTEMEDRIEALERLNKLT